MLTADCFHASFPRPWCLYNLYWPRRTLARAMADLQVRCMY